MIKAKLIIIAISDYGDHWAHNYDFYDSRWDSAMWGALEKVREIDQDAGRVVAAHLEADTVPPICKTFQPRDWQAERRQP